MQFKNIFYLIYQHIVECHSETLLPQYVGMYRTTIESKEYYYLVIRNVLSNKRKIHKKYDLKVSCGASRYLILSFLLDLHYVLYYVLLL